MLKNLVNSKEISSDHSDVLVIGCGYLGSKVAHLAGKGGADHQTNRVFTTTRSSEKAAYFESLSWIPVLLDWTDQRSVSSLKRQLGSDTQCNLRVLISVSYDRRSDRSRYESQVGGLSNLLAVLPDDARICYISTTGVYHQTDGVWVDETSPTRPDREGGKVHLAAESLIRRKRATSPAMILRLSGIYGPDRVPRSADVISGRPIASPKNGFLNLIHVDDAAMAVFASWSRMSIQQRGDSNNKRHLYVVSDDHPVIRGDFYREIARQAKVSPPKFVDPEHDAPVRMRSNSNKRVWNRRMKADLLPDLKFPSYRDGLANVLESILQ